MPLYLFEPNTLYTVHVEMVFWITGVIIIIIISDEEIRVTLLHRDVAGALYIN